MLEKKKKRGKKRGETGTGIFLKRLGRKVEPTVLKLNAYESPLSASQPVDSYRLAISITFFDIMLRLCAHSMCSHVITHHNTW